MSDKRGDAEATANLKFVVFVVALWFLLVLIFAKLGQTEERPLNFEATGQFGDSFGFIGAIMASTAAYFAFRTYRSQKEEAELLRQERDEALRTRAEPSFLTLIERRYDALEQALYDPGVPTGPTTGQKAVMQFASDIKTGARTGAANALVEYNRLYVYTRNLPHLYRFTYHIIRYAEMHFDHGVAVGRPVTRDDLAYQFVRLLRSQLSADEMFIIALNALTPDGAGAKPFIEKYALLHNMDPVDRHWVTTCGHTWRSEAFGLP